MKDIGRLKRRAKSTSHPNGLSHRKKMGFRFPPEWAGSAKQIAGCDHGSLRSFSSAASRSAEFIGSICREDVGVAIAGKWIKQPTPTQASQEAPSMDSYVVFDAVVSPVEAVLETGSRTRVRNGRRSAWCGPS